MHLGADFKGNFNMKPSNAADFWMRLQDHQSSTNGRAQATEIVQMAVNWRKLCLIRKSMFCVFKQHLRVELAERDRAQQEMMKEWEVWKERDSALTALVQDNKDYIAQLKKALENSRRDVQVDALLSRSGSLD